MRTIAVVQCERSNVNAPKATAVATSSSAARYDIACATFLSSSRAAPAKVRASPSDERLRVGRRRSVRRTVAKDRKERQALRLGDLEGRSQEQQRRRENISHCLG